MISVEKEDDEDTTIIQYHWWKLMGEALSAFSQWWQVSMWLAAWNSMASVTY